MKVRIAAERCQGHGMCQLLCPRVFGHDEDGFGTVLPGMEAVPDKLRDEVSLAELQCPERAVVLEV